jgi:hypothetical protein
VCEREREIEKEREGETEKDEFVENKLEKGLF